MLRMRYAGGSAMRGTGSFGLVALILVICWLKIGVPASSAQTATPTVQSSLPNCGPMTTSLATLPAIPPSGQSAATPTGSTVLQTMADVPLPGSASRFDYQSFDPTTGRLYIAHMGAGELVVFDTKAQKVVGTIKDLP